VNTARTFHITHVLTANRAGGLERVVEMLAPAQARRGHDVTVVAAISATAPEPPLIGELARAGITVVTQPVSGRHYAEERRRFAQVLAQRPPGIVHSHGYRGDLVYAPVGMASGNATVSTLHGFVGGDFKNRLYEYLQRRAVRRYDRVAVVSKPLYERMRQFGVAVDRLALIPNAFRATTALASRDEARQRFGVADDRFLVGWVGRLSREKGADVLVDALPALRDLPVTVAFVGDGPEAAELRAQAVRLGVDHMVHWAGSVDGASRLFSAFDVLAMSSRTEGTPIVLFEAMAAKIPIVAAAVGGIPDVVSAAEAALVSPEAPAALADAIRATLVNGATAAERADRAVRVLNERYAVEPWLDRYDETYAAALAHQARRAAR
jgi:glycosyltransferase involved in cell wall biosynthesis